MGFAVVVSEVELLNAARAGGVSTAMLLEELIEVSTVVV